MTRTVKRENGQTIISIPTEEEFTLRCGLDRKPMMASTSPKVDELCKSLSRGLAQLEINQDRKGN